MKTNSCFYKRTCVGMVDQLIEWLLLKKAAINSFKMDPPVTSPKSLTFTVHNDWYLQNLTLEGFIQFIYEREKMLQYATSKTVMWKLESPARKHWVWTRQWSMRHLVSSISTYIFIFIPIIKLKLHLHWGIQWNVFLKGIVRHQTTPKQLSMRLTFGRPDWWKKRKKLKMATDAAVLAKHHYAVCWCLWVTTRDWLQQRKYQI